MKIIIMRREREEIKNDEVPFLLVVAGPLFATTAETVFNDAYNSTSCNSNTRLCALRRNSSHE